MDPLRARQYRLNNKGIILPLSLLMVMSISLLALALWLLSYYANLENDNFQQEIIAANVYESALARLDYDANRGIRDPQEREETFPAECYGFPVKYKTSKNGKNQLTIDIFMSRNKGWQPIKHLILTEKQ